MDTRKSVLIPRISKTRQDKGIGSQLMDFAEKKVFSETPNIFICVSSSNIRVQKLYERRGYEVIGELKDSIVLGHSETLLRKTIGPLTEFTIE